MAYFYVKPKGNIHHLMVDDAICPNAQWRSDLEFSFFFHSNALILWLFWRGFSTFNLEIELSLRDTQMTNGSEINVLVFCLLVF